MSLAPFLDPLEVSRGVAEIIRPPRRLHPAEAIEAYLRTEKGPWQRDLAPMFIEPVNELAGRRYQGICVVGPSRTSKTMTLVLGAVTYIVTCAPADTLIVHTSQDTAREYSRKDLDRAIRHSPALSERLSPSPRDDNVFDKYFRSGMVLNIGWPSARQLASRTFKYVLITDYDRPDNRDDVDGEGALWDLAIARVRTFMSRGKCLAESSPGGEYLDPQWHPTTPHEAPPGTGITAVYNRGTRARWYWPCLHCGEYFQAQPGLANFPLPPIEELEKEVQRKDLMWLAEQFARVPCPHCGAVHMQEQKSELNARGRWLHEGESVDPSGRITGERRRTDIASYWQGGCSATYQSWVGLLLRFLQGVQTYVRTGDESSLKATTNTDQAALYLPRAVAKRRDTDVLMARREEWERGVVPSGVRFLTAAVDVQSNRFVVLVMGWGAYLESWVVDHFVISSSRRPEGPDRMAALDPASYLEDWDILLEELLLKTYPVEGYPECRLEIRLALCDSGGRAGVTENAYKFWRYLRKSGYGRRFQLVKGVGQLNAPRAQLTWPDSRGRLDRSAGSRGDVPVWQINTNVLKDGVAGDLAREQPGPGYIHLPMWLGPEYFDELTIETRTEKGWVKPSGARNEAFDLHVYNRAAVIALRAEAINWDDPPDWAKPPSGHPTPPQAAQGEKAEGGDRDQPSPPPGIVWRRSTYWDGDE